MIDRHHQLSIVRQVKLLGLSRRSVYFLPRPVPEGDLALMQRIDELHLDYLFAGSRMLKGVLESGRTGSRASRHRDAEEKMGIEPIYRRPSTSKPAPDHKVYPYNLRKLAVTRPNQVWATTSRQAMLASRRGDIAYIPMARGFVYGCAVVGRVSYPHLLRKILAWEKLLKLSENTLSIDTWQIP